MTRQALTTAWFIDNLDHWFYLTTDKTSGLSLHNKFKHKEAIDFLKDIIILVRTMKVTTQDPVPKTSWKPIQRGVIMSTTTVLQMQEHFLKDLGYYTFLPGRLTSDAIENFFSLIRQGNSSPNTLQFTYYLKLLTISQYMNVPKSSSYNVDDSLHLIDLLDGGGKRKLEKSDKPSILEINGPTNAISIPELNDTERAIFHDMCGYFVMRMLKKTKCEKLERIATYPVPTLPIHRLTQLKEYCSDGYCLTYVQEGVFKFLENCEKIFQENVHNFTTCSSIRKGLIILLEDIPNTTSCKCHDIKKHLITIFAQSRIGICIKKIRRKQKTIQVKGSVPII